MLMYHCVVIMRVYVCCMNLPQSWYTIRETLVECGENPDEVEQKHTPNSIEGGEVFERLIKSRRDLQPLYIRTCRLNGKHLTKEHPNSIGGSPPQSMGSTGFAYQKSSLKDVRGASRTTLNKGRKKVGLVALFGGKDMLSIDW